MGIIIATHLPEAFLDISDRVIIMDRGNIVKDSRKVFETVRLYINEVESHD